MAGSSGNGAGGGATAGAGATPAAGKQWLTAPADTPMQGPTSLPSDLLAPGSNAGSDDARLAALGYTQQLDREMGLASNFALSFSIVSVLTGITGLYTIGYANGGPVVVIWGWVGVVFGTMLVAASMAEICSSLPTSGGTYFWAYELAPPSGRALAAWLTGWLNLVGQAAVTAGITFTCTQTLVQVVQLGQVQLSPGEPVWSPSPGIYFAIYVCLTVVHALLNSMPMRLIAKLDVFSAGWHVVGTGAFVITLLVIAPAHQPASFVFTKFQANPDLPSPAYSFLTGLLMSFFTLTGYDASAKVSEESRNAARTAPLGILLCVACAGTVGFAYLLSITFSIQQPDDLLSPTNTFGGTAAVAQVVLDACTARYGAGSTSAAASSVALMCIPLVAQFFCGLASLTSNSRTLFSFARDRALPQALAWVTPRSHTPLVATWVMAAAVVVMGSPMLGSAVAFSAITSIAAIGLYCSYGVPIALRVTYGRATFPPGPITLGAMGVPVGVAATLWVLFLTAVLILPTAYPVTVSNLNYAPVMLGGVLVLVLGWWAASARRWFDGPNTAAGVWGGESRGGPAPDSSIAGASSKEDSCELGKAPWAAGAGDGLASGGSGSARSLTKAKSRYHMPREDSVTSSARPG